MFGESPCMYDKSIIYAYNIYIYIYIRHVRLHVPRACWVTCAGQHFQFSTGFSNVIR